MMAVLPVLVQLMPRLLLAGAAALAVHYVHGLGLAAGRAEVQAQWDGQTIAGLSTNAEQLTQAIARTAAMGDKLDAIHTTNQQSHADAKRVSQTLLADLRSGAIRLSIPAAASGPDLPRTGAGGATAAAVQARTELDPATGASLVAVTDDGDAGIRDLNACIDAYNTVRAQVNATAGKP